jgi:hypothetical protein
MKKMVLRTAGIAVLAAAGLATTSAAAFATNDAAEAPNPTTRHAYCNGSAGHYEGYTFTGVANNGVQGTFKIDVYVVQGDGKIRIDSYLNASTEPATWYCNDGQ